MLKENSFEENSEEKQRRIFFLSLFKIRFNCVLTFTLANTSKSQYGVKFSSTNGVLSRRGGKKTASNWLSRCHPKYSKRYKELQSSIFSFPPFFPSPTPFPLSPLFFPPLSSLSFLFFSIPNAFHSAGRNSDRVKYFASSNGRTISTFSELIIGARVSRGGRRGGGRRLSVVTNSPRFVG